MGSDGPERLVVEVVVVRIDTLEEEVLDENLFVLVTNMVDMLVWPLVVETIAEVLTVEACDSPPTKKSNIFSTIQTTLTKKPQPTKTSLP